MADFKTSFDITNKIEAGYTVDNGGETYAGIAFKNWKTDPYAQKILGIVRAANPLKGQKISHPQLPGLIQAFYKTNYWDRIYGDNIDNQDLANFIYDFFVNSNSAPAIINNAIGTRGSIGFTEDTLKQLNDKPAWCYLQIWNARKAKYDKLRKKPGLRKYYTGWIARLNSFPNSISA